MTWSVSRKSPAWSKCLSLSFTPSIAVSVTSSWSAGAKRKVTTATRVGLLSLFHSLFFAFSLSHSLVFRWNLPPFLSVTFSLAISFQINCSVRVPFYFRLASSGRMQTLRKACLYTQGERAGHALIESPAEINGKDECNSPAVSSLIVCKLCFTHWVRLTQLSLSLSRLMSPLHFSFPLLLITR